MLSQSGGERADTQPHLNPLLDLNSLGLPEAEFRYLRSLGFGFWIVR